MFACFKTKIREYQDEDLASEPLRTWSQHNSLLLAMVRALHESLDQNIIPASFLNTGIYPWNPEKKKENARAALTDPCSVDPDLPIPIQNEILSRIEASPRDNKVTVSRFQKYGIEDSAPNTFEAILHQHTEYHQKRHEAALEKEENARKR